MVVNKLLLLLLGLCSSFPMTKTFGFQHQTIKITTSASASHRRPKIRKGPSAAALLPAAIHFQQYQRHHPNPIPSLSFVVAIRQIRTGDSSRLHAFGGGRGNFSPPSTPPTIRTKKDIWQSLQLILTGIVRQFMSGFISGYLLGSIWGLVRGPSLTVASRGMAWGLDFGFLSALFAGTSTVTEFLLALTSKSSSSENRKAETKINDDDDDDDKSLRNKRRQQKASLWSVVIRNMILAIYFCRNNGGIVKMARLSALYGGLTYYFVGNKIKRDNAERMSIMFGANNNHPGSSAEAIMQQFLQQMMAMQHQQQGHHQMTTRMGTPPPPQPKSTITPPRPSKSSSSASSSSLFTDKYKSKKVNAVDVEFEKVDKTDKD